VGKILHNSRKQANFLRSLGKDVNEMDHVKHFIASCNIDEFMKFVHITRVSDNFREIEYEIRIPE
jgi:hypothetical protein